MQTAEPAKEEAKESIKLLVDKYQRLLEAGKVKLEKEIQKINNEIDQEVYKIYEITEEERKIIEENLK